MFKLNKCRNTTEILYWIELDCTSVPVLKRTEQYNFFLPNGLHTACKALVSTLDEDCIDVLLLQLLVQDVNMRHDQMKQLQKKHKVFILQHPQEARCLSHCSAVK